MRKVLLIAYYFPPSGGAGVQRPLKFVKYLRDFGWEPVVLTAQNAQFPARDLSLFSQIPKGVPIRRTKIFEPHKLYRKVNALPSHIATDIAAMTPENKSALSRERISALIRSIFFVPDARIGWLPFAINAGKKIMEEEKIDVLLSTAPPYTAHLIGAKLKDKTGLPWAADFRDSWIGWVSTPSWRPRISRWIERRMEHYVLERADKILTASRGIKTDLLGRHGQFNDNRWVFLPNGFDPPDIETAISAPRDCRIVITYIGSMYGARNPEFLLEALAQIQSEQGRLENRLLIRIVGRVAKSIAEKIDSSPVAGVFELIPYLPHEQCLGYLKASDYSLLIIDDVPGSEAILTGKVYEYIGVGKPILALAPEGEAADLIRENNFGTVVHFRDVPNIKKILLDILNSSTFIGSGDEKRRKPFERRSQTARLAKILDSLVENR